MKKLLFSFFALLLTFGTISAQDAEENLKAAGKSWKKAMTANMSEKLPLLDEAGKQLDMAMEGVAGLEEKNSSKLYKLRGEVYNEKARQLVGQATLDPSKVKEYSSAIKAYESYKALLETSTKKSGKRDALAGLDMAADNLSNMASISFTAGDYKSSYHNFYTLKQAYDLLKTNGKTTNIIPTEEKYNTNMFYAAITASASGMTEEAMPLLQKLYDMKYDDVAIYENLVKIYMDTDEEKAMKVMTEGREKYPESESMLVAEINYYMKNNKLDELVGKLEKAIEMDPTNTSFQLALGSTFDNLTQREMKAGNKEKADEFFNKAKSYYQKTLEIEEDNQTAVYSTGALYYNKAASMLAELIALEEQGDYSKAGMAKQTEMRADILKEFDKALPFFQKAETLDPNDINTLLALKEIFARKDDFAKSKVFKERIETIQDGTTIEESYFKNN